MSYHSNRFLISLAGYRSWNMLVLDVYDIDSSHNVKRIDSVHQIPWAVAQRLLDTFNFVSVSVANSPCVDVEFHLNQCLNLEEIDFSFNEIYTNDSELCKAVVLFTQWAMCG
jgi:hypothetical protein